MKKVDYYFCKQFKLDLDQARHKRVGLELHLNSVRSDVDLLVMFLGEFFQNEFYANSLNQIKPDIIMSGLAPRPRHARIQMGGEGVRRSPSKISQKHSFFSNWSGPLKITKLQFMYGKTRHSSETSFKWRFSSGADDGPLIVVLCLPPFGSGDILFFPGRPSVRLSVHLSVCHKSCPLYNLKTA